MGMFDYIQCEHKLSGKWYKDVWFQTKDLSLELAEYKISKEGRLLKMKTKHTRVPLKKRPYYKKWLKDKKNPSAILLKLAGSIKVTKLGWEDTHTHGTVVFYTNAKNGRWMEYMATFDRGQLQQIEKVPPRTMRRAQTENKGGVQCKTTQKTRTARSSTKS